MKNEKGLTYTKLLVIVVILIIGSIVAYKISNKIILNQKLNNIKTDMLLIQGKSKLISDDVAIKKEGAELIGISISENMEEEHIKHILEKQIIWAEDADFNGYYLLSKENLNQMELSDINIDEDNEVIVNYATGEVIYTKEFVDKDGKIYHKLSELQDVKTK